MTNTIRKLFIGAAFMFSPFLVSAQAITLPVPTHLSPFTNRALTTTTFTSADWNDLYTSTGSTTSALSYYYEASGASTTTADGSFVSQLVASPLLATSSISTVGTREGLYFWHVRSVDTFGNKSGWSNASSIIIDNTAPTTPGVPSVTSTTTAFSMFSNNTNDYKKGALWFLRGHLPFMTSSSTRETSQVWSFGEATDTLSGVASYEYSLDGNTTWTSLALTRTLKTNLSVGTHTLSIVAIDRSGNRSAVAYGTYTVILNPTSTTTVPVITPATTTPPTNIHACEHRGWARFNHFRFKNEKKCIDYIKNTIKEKQKKNQSYKNDKKHFEKEDSRRGNH
jgi:hypothetical protein